MNKYLVLVTVLILAATVFAVHNSTVAISPSFSGKATVSYDISVASTKGDKISEVRITIPAAFTALSCGSAPAGWVLAYSDMAECSYKTTKDYIIAGSSRTFSVNVTTSDTGNYTWEVRTKDVFDGFSLKNPVVFVDAAGPSIKGTTLEYPNGGEDMTFGDVVKIEWKASDITDDNLAVNPISLFYTADGSEWILIAGSEPNDGAYDWAVPETNSSVAKIRIAAADKAGNIAYDESDSAFSIAPSILGVEIRVGQTYGIDLNNDKKNDVTILLKKLDSEKATLIVTASGTVAGTTTTVPQEQKPGGTTNIIIIILILVVLYLLWKMQSIEKKKKKEEK